MNRFICVCVALGSLLVVSAFSEAAGKGGKKIIIDASKDGGAWWSPQSIAGPFDAAKPHQGKDFADALRARGFVVDEFGRDVKVTPESLRGADIVIRPRIFYAYSQPEVDAYQEAIAKGLHVILIAQPAAKIDAVSSKLGFEYAEFQEIGGPYSLRKHPLTAGFAAVESHWATISKIPNDATALGAMPSGNSVAALRVVDKGVVVSLGSPLHESAPIVLNLIQVLHSTPATALKKKLEDAKLETREGVGPKAPMLLVPAEGAVLAQGPAEVWRFEWARVDNAIEYEVVLLGSSASYPLIKTKTAQIVLEHKFGNGAIAPHNKANWSWSVRTRNAAGMWGAWAGSRKFDVK